MKVLHWVSVVVMALLTLMNLGAIGGSDVPTGVVIFGIVLGVAGLVALYGMIRRTPWGPMAAIAVAIANVLSAVIGGIAGWDGWQIGLAVSVVATALVVISESGALRGNRVATVK
jgi:hypothetical protein